MKKNLILLCSLFMATALISSCAQDAMEPEVDAAATGAETRAYGDKTPKVMMYIEVNDTNPLNTMLYRMNNEPFIDITTIFAANIRANGSEPALWLNDNVTKILVPDAGSTTTGHYKYVQPIRQDGGKVLMTILGDHQGVGVANLTEANQDKFAEILAWAVEEYQLDGIDFDDEWAKYGENPNFPSSVSGSFNGLIAKLRAKLDARFPNDHKLITALARVSGAGSLHDAELTSVAMAPWGDMQPAARSAAAASAVRQAARIGRIAPGPDRLAAVRSIFAATEPRGRIAAPANFTAAISAAEHFRPSIGMGARPSAPGNVP